MRHFLAGSAAVLLAIGGTAAFAADAAAQAAAAATPKYTTAGTEIGTLLDDPAAKAIVAKYIPGFVDNPQVEMARGMTLRAIQSFVPQDVTDERLQQIDADLAKLAQ